jgi:hypothetical protein
VPAIKRPATTIFQLKPDKIFTSPRDSIAHESYLLDKASQRVYRFIKEVNVNGVKQVLLLVFSGKVPLIQKGALFF